LLGQPPEFFTGDSDLSGEEAAAASGSWDEAAQTDLSIPPQTMLVPLVPVHGAAAASLLDKGLSEELGVDEKVVITDALRDGQSGFDSNPEAGAEDIDKDGKESITDALLAAAEPATAQEPAAEAKSEDASYVSDAMDVSNDQGDVVGEDAIEGEGRDLVEKAVDADSIAMHVERCVDSGIVADLANLQERIDVRIALIARLRSQADVDEAAYHERSVSDLRSQMRDLRAQMVDP